MKHRDLHDGRSDGLVPLSSVDLTAVQTFGDLLRSMSNTAFAGRQLGEAFDILLEMFQASDVSVVLTLSGAMTVEEHTSA